MTDVLHAAGSAQVRKKWQCPVHAATGEHSPSLSVSRGREGGVLLFCHAGCKWDDILRALVLPMSAMWTPPATPGDRHAQTYLRRLKFPPPKRDDAGDSAGWVAASIAEHPYGEPTPFAWKVRERNSAGVKRMRWESLNPKGERVPGLLSRREADLPLYRERDVRMAVAADEPVLLVESESSVDALVKAGHYATTWAGGASSPPVERIADLLGSHPGTLLIPDHDDAGIACAEKLVRAHAVRHLLLGEPGEDARDLLARLGASAFLDLVKERLRPSTDPAIPMKSLSEWLSEPDPRTDAERAVSFLAEADLPPGEALEHLRPQWSRSDPDERRAIEATAGTIADLDVHDPQQVRPRAVAAAGGRNTTERRN